MLPTPVSMLTVRRGLHAPPDSFEFLDDTTVPTGAGTKAST